VLIIRTIQHGTLMPENDWLAQFQQVLIQQDLADTTIKGYLSDVGHFSRWLEQIQQQSVPLAHTTTADLRAYRQHLVNIQRQKPAAVNRRIQALFLHSAHPP
jgi:site-specific recombinase XerD